MTMPLPAERTAEDAAAIRAGIAMERLLNTWLRERTTESVPVEGEACTLNVGANRLRASCLRASPGCFHRCRLPVLIEV